MLLILIFAAQSVGNDVQQENKSSPFFPKHWMRMHKLNLLLNTLSPPLHWQTSHFNDIWSCIVVVWLYRHFVYILLYRQDMFEREKCERCRLYDCGKNITWWVWESGEMNCYTQIVGAETKRQKCSWNEWECIRDRHSFNWKSVTVMDWVDIKKSCWFRSKSNTSTNISKYDFVFSPVEVLNMTIHTKYMFLSRLFSTYLNL